MPIEVSDAAIVITGPEIEVARWLTIRRGIKLEIATGMQMSRGRSCVKIARAELGLPSRTPKPKVLEAVEAMMREAGIPESILAK